MYSYNIWFSSAVIPQNVIIPFSSTSIRIYYQADTCSRFVFSLFILLNTLMIIPKYSEVRVRVRLKQHFRPWNYTPCIVHIENEWLIWVLYQWMVKKANIESFIILNNDASSFCQINMLWRWGSFLKINLTRVVANIFSFKLYHVTSDKKIFFRKTLSLCFNSLSWFWGTNEQ